jgi:TusA-related sulfurtransferase
MPASTTPQVADFDHAIDITGRLCPMTFVHTRLALDKLRPGQVLRVCLKGREPRTNVPRSVIELGHSILAMQDQPDGTTLVTIRKASGE